MSQQDRNAELVALLETDFVGRNEPNYAWKSACSSIQALPGLRGFWPMSAFGSTGNAFDQSGNIRTLTYNGNPTYNYNGLVPYIDFDGTGDYLSAIDHPSLDILGTETYVAAAARGLTTGGWFYAGVLTALMFAIGKGLVVDATDSYRLLWRGDLANDPFFFSVSNGAAQISITSTIPTSTSLWYFAVGRYVPSTSIDIYVNNNKNTLAAGVYAALGNSPDPFTVGASGTPNSHLTGRASLCWLCAEALSDTMISALFENQRAMFNV
ncbi:MAG: hypothetical protein ACXAEN_14310 [Candidatus Thorarchaeota archaeon]|jgi:hypothetical protein